jgi:hypothetical protein
VLSDDVSVKQRSCEKALSNEVAKKEYYTIKYLHQNILYVICSYKMGFFSDLFSGIKDVATKVYESVKDPVSKIFKAVDPVIRGLGPIGNAVSTIGNTIGNLASGDLAGAAKSVGSGLLRQFGNPLRNIPVVGGFLADASQKALGLARGGMVDKKGMHMMPDGKMMKDSAMAMGGMVGAPTKDKYKKGLEPNMPVNKFQK